MTPPHQAKDLLARDYPPEVEQLLEAFEEAWQSGVPPALGQFLSHRAAPRGASQRDFLEDLVRIDMEYRWRIGVPGSAEDPIQPRPRLENYVARFPLLGRLEQLSVELIGAEYLVRQRWGDRPGQGNYSVRFPNQAEALKQELPRIDRELLAEFARQGKPPSNSRGALEATPPGIPPAMDQPSGTVSALVATLRQLEILQPTELAQLPGILAQTSLDPRGLGRELLQRGWLTPYQVNQLLQGRGAELVLGGYLLLERLGEGGVGQVFKARQQRMMREVALKVLRKDLLNDPEVVARFYREIRVISQLEHPNLVRAYDAGPWGTTHFLAMEYIAGTDLARLVKQSGPLPPAIACEYLRQAALGLQHAHERGLVHRDIKPPNILLLGPEEGKSGQGGSACRRAKIADFGLARLQHTAVTDDLTHVLQERTGSSLLTPIGAMMVGTPDFMAPEQAIDFHQADIRADIYSLGCTLYYLVTGQAPFAGGSLAEKIAGHLHKQPPPVTDLRPELPRGLNHLLQRLLAKQPEHRFQTPAEVAAALSDPGFLTTAPLSLSASANTQHTQPNDPTVKSRRARSRRWFLGGAAGFLLVLVGLWKAKSGRVANSARQPVVPVVDAAWREKVSRLLAKDQVEEVVKRLIALNPGLDGKLCKSNIEHRAVTSLGFPTDHVTDISPVAALTHLRSLDCGGTVPDKGILADLTPLKGLSLTRLACYSTQVSDLSPLKDMPLTYLDCSRTKVVDLSPLMGLPLRELGCSGTFVKSVAPLLNMPLERLHLSGTRVTDAGLKGLGGLKQLRALDLSGTLVSDVGLQEVVKLTQLRELSLFNCRNVKNDGVKQLLRLEQLKALNLSSEQVDNEGAKHLAGLKQLENLSLYKTPVNDDGLKQLAKLTHLKSLAFRGARLTNAGMRELHKLKDLKMLILSDTEVDEAAIRELRNALPQLDVRR